MPDTGTDPGDWGSVLRGIRRSRRLTLGEVADVLAVGPESLALLEAGEWGWGVDGSEGAYLLAEYARVLGLDQAVVRGWLREGASVSAGLLDGADGAAPVPAPHRVDGNGRLPLTGSARFARPLPSFAPVVPPTVAPTDPYLALKEARVRAGLSLEDTGHLLDMRSDFVATMERGDVGRLPRGYERGMLTRYSAFLGLDPRPVLEGLPGSTSVARPSQPKRPHRVALWIRFSGGVLIVAGLVLAAISVS